MPQLIQSPNHARKQFLANAQLLLGGGTGSSSIVKVVTETVQVSEALNNPRGSVQRITETVQISEPTPIQVVTAQAPVVSFNQNLLQCKVRIQNTSGTWLTYDPFNPAGAQDFVLTRATIKPAYDTTGGMFECTIASSDGSNTQANVLLSQIIEGREILFTVGKDSTTATDVLRGVVEKIEIEEPTKSLMYIHVSGFDWGTDVLSGRVINLYREQKRLPNGKDPDTTDPTTNIANIVKLLLGFDAIHGQNDRSAYIGDKANPSTLVSVKDQGLIVDGTYITDTGTSVPRIEFNISRLADALVQLNAIAGTTSYVRPDKVFVMKVPKDTTGFTGSAFLLTDDNTDTVAATWDPNRLAFIRPPATMSRSLENHRRRILAVDQTQGEPDQKYETDTDFVDNKTTYVAVQFTPTRRKCSSIAVKVGKTGFAATDEAPVITVELREDLNGSPNGSQIAIQQKTPSEVDTAGPSGDWEYFSVNSTLNTGKQYWIVVWPASSGTKYYTLRNGAAVGGNPTKTSTDGANWSATTSYTLDFRQDVTDDVIILFPPTVHASDKHLWEEVLKPVTSESLSNVYSMVKYLNTQFSTMIQRKDSIKMSVIPPTDLMLPGMPVHIRKQKSGYKIDDDFVITAIQYVFESTPDMVTGTYYVELTASKFTPYT